MSLKVIDTMDVVKTSKFIFGILEEATTEVGQENVVQVITNNVTNCVGAGRLVMQRFPHIYWTPCAAHCIDLLLHDLGKLAWVNEVIRQARTLSHFVVNHRLTLSIYRKTASRELLRPCDTRFATFFITLERVVEEKSALRSILCDGEWERSSLSKKAKGVQVEGILLSSTFWEKATKVLQICEPIVGMLRKVDSDIPSMGFVYEGMDRVKEAIAKAFNDAVDDYQPIWDIADARWKMLHTHLLAAACYLDPRLFGIDRTYDDEVMQGLYKAIENLILDPNTARIVRAQLRAYKMEEGIFGIAAAKEDRENTLPGVWWRFYASGAPELQKFAIRILSQCSSASSCERNWSSFEQIHTKKRSKLLSGRLGDLVYVRSNLRLATNNVSKNSENLDTPNFEPVSFTLEVDIEPESSGHEDGYISPPCALDDIDLDDITS